MNEIWKPIKGFEGVYEVSNLGNVRSMDRMVGGRFNKEWFKKGVVLSQKPNTKGNLKVTLVKHKKNHHLHVHTLVADAFVSNPMNLPHVEHKDGNKLNNVYTNLAWKSWCSDSTDKKSNYLLNGRKSNRWIKDNDLVTIDGKEMKVGQFEDIIIKMSYVCNLSNTKLMDFLGLDKKEFNKFMFGHLPPDITEYNYNKLKKLYDSRMRKYEQLKNQKKGKAINAWDNVSSLFIAPKRAN